MRKFQYNMNKVKDRVRYLLTLPEGKTEEQREEWLETRRAYLEIWERRYGSKEDRKTKKLFAKRWAKRKRNE